MFNRVDSKQKKNKMVTLDAVLPMQSFSQQVRLKHGFYKMRCTRHNRGTTRVICNCSLYLTP